MWTNSKTLFWRNLLVGLTNLTYNVTTLTVIILSFLLLSVIMLSVVLLSVMAATSPFLFQTFNRNINF